MFVFAPDCAVRISVSHLFSCVLLCDSLHIHPSVTAWAAGHKYARTNWCTQPVIALSPYKIFDTYNRGSDMQTHAHQNIHAHMHTNMQAHTHTHAMCAHTCLS